MARVRRVPVAVVHVVRVVLVRDADVPAVRTVLVGVGLVRRVAGGRALVGVVAVVAVQMSVVRVVGVSVVGDRDVPAAGTVPVLVSGVRCVVLLLLCCIHGRNSWRCHRSSINTL
jgi:hypothetical protein